MKRALLVFLLFFSVAMNAQDIIILKNNSDTIFCKVVKDRIVSIDYILPGDTAVQSVKTADTEGYLMGKYELNEEEQAQYINAYQQMDRESASENKYLSGIYINVDDFLNNSPSIKGDVYRTKKSLATNDMANREYKILVIDSLGIKHNFFNTYWGYSDGKCRYVQHKHFMKRTFHKIYPVGDHFVFDVVRNSATMAPSPGIVMPVGSSFYLMVSYNNNQYSWSKNFVHGQTGIIYELNENTLKSLNIKESDKLWDEFNEFKSLDSKRKKAFMKQYYYNP